MKISRILPLAIASVPLMIACDRPIAETDGAIMQVAVDIPADAQAGALPTGAVTFVTAEVAGLVAETKLLQSATHATGSLAFAVPVKTTAPTILRIYGAVDASSAPAVLYVAEQDLSVAPGIEVFAGKGASFVRAVDAAHPFLDLNRNGRDNLGDLAVGCDPGVPPSFVRVSATDVQFTAGVASRQVVVVDNLVQRSITVRGDVVDAAGVGVSVLLAGAEEAPSLPTTGDLVVAPGGSLLLALSFQPANPFLSTGFLAIESIDDADDDATRCKTRTSSSVRIIANVDGGPRSVLDPTASPPVVATGADLGGQLDAASVAGFPLENAASGAAVGVELSATPSGTTVAGAPADKAFLVEVPRGGRLSTSLSGLPFDADLHLFQLGDNDKLGAELPRRPPAADAAVVESDAQPLPGTGLEAGDVVADAFLDPGADALRVLVVVGTSGATEPRLQGADVPSQGQLVVHVITAPRLISPPTPPQAPVSGGAAIVLAGNGLKDGGRVLFGDIAAACDTVVDDGAGRSHISCTAPAGTLAFGRNPVDVTYQSPPDAVSGAFETAALVQGFLYVPDQPVVTSVDPPVVSVDGGELISIRGFGFTDRYGPVAVKIDGTTAGSVGVISDSEVVAAVPPHAAGAVAVDVVVRAQDGSALTGTLDNALLYTASTAPAPTLTSVSPPLGPVVGGTQVTVFGTGFQQGLTVTFDGVAADVVVAGSTAAVVISPSTNNGAGNVDVVLANPDGQSASLSDGFTYFVEPVQPPGPTSLAPNGGDVAGGDQVTIFGAGFDADATVTFGGTSAAVVGQNATSIVVTSPPHAAGAVDVRVTNDDLQTGTLAGAFTYAAPPIPPPDLISLTPSSGDVAGGNTITLIGASFATVASGAGGNATVTVGGQSCAVTSAGTGALVCTAPAHAAGAATVVVRNPDGQTDSIASGYTYTSGQSQTLNPSILSVVPTPAHAGVAAEQLTVLGGDLQTTLSARIVDGHSAGFSGAATITSASSSLVTIVVDNALPSSDALAVELTAAGGTKTTSPAFAAQAPTPLDVTSRGRADEGSPFTLVVDGFALNPDHLVSLRAVPLDPQSGAAVDLPISFAAETVASSSVAAGVLGRGGWTISLVYDDSTVVPVQLLEVGGACPGSALCALCGDGIRDPGEQCDGNDFGGTTCESLSSTFDGGHLSCTGCQFDASTCTACGNSVVENGEQCDGSNLGGATCATLGFAAPNSGAPLCSAQCSLGAGTCAHCGDGVCAQTENHTSCAADCPATCGDNVCNAGIGETCSTCPHDCNTCAPYHLVLDANSPNQSAKVTGTLPQLITVKLLDGNDNPVPNAPVTFTVAAGDAMSQTIVNSDGIGQASAAWSLGARVGTHTVSITAVSPDGTAIANQPLNVDATALDVAPGTIITLAGDGTVSLINTSFGPGGAGLRSHLNLPKSVAVTASGDFIIYLAGSCEILKLAMPNGVLSRVTGFAGACNVGNVPPPDHLQATDPALKYRAGKDVVIGPDQAIYFSENYVDSGASPQSTIVRRIDPVTDEVSVVAGSTSGSPTLPPFGDGLPAKGANLDVIDGISFAPNGDLIVTEAGAHDFIRRFAAPITSTGFGVTSTINIPTPFFFNNGVVSSANLTGPIGPVLIVSDSPPLFVASVAVNANGFNTGGLGVCDPAVGCTLSNGSQLPQGLFPTTTDGTGFSFGADSAGHVIRRFDGVGGSVVVAGTGTQGFSGDFGPATSAQIQTPTRVAVTPTGDLVFVDARQTLRLVRGAALGTNSVTLIASNGDAQSTRMLAATAAPLQAKVTANGAGAASALVSFLPQLGQTLGTASTFTDAGGFAGTSLFTARFVAATPAEQVQTIGASLKAPLSRLFPGASTSFTVTATQPTASQSTTAFGGAINAYPTTSATALINITNGANGFNLSQPAFDDDGTLFFSDNGLHRVVKLSPEGIAIQVAGVIGSSGFAGDNGLATGAKLNNPVGVSFTPANELFIADAANNRIRKIDASGIITTVAGTGSSANELGDGGPAISANLIGPSGVAAFADGSFYTLGQAQSSQLNFIDASQTFHHIGAQIFNAVCGNPGTPAAPQSFIPGTTTSPVVAPNGHVFVAARVLANGAACAFGSQVIGNNPGEYLFEVDNGAFIGHRLIDPGANSGVARSIAVRADGVVFMVFTPASTSQFILKAFKTDNTLVDVPGAPSPIDEVGLGPDGLLYLLDDTNKTVHIFAPPF